MKFENKGVTADQPVWTFQPFGSSVYPHRTELCWLTRDKSAIVLAWTVDGNWYAKCAGSGKKSKTYNAQTVVTAVNRFIKYGDFDMESLDVESK